MSNENKKTTKNVDLYKKLTDASIDKTVIKDAVIIPSGLYKDIIEFINKTNDIEIDDANELTDEEMLVTGLNYDSRNKTLRNNMCVEDINSEEYTNNAKYANKKLGINHVSINTKGKLSGSNAIAKFTSALSLGKHTSVTLWHSGFTVLIAPPKEADIISLQYNISKLEYELERETNNLIYSNYGAVINKLLANFIVDHIISSSFAIPEDESYLDYIKVTDLNPLVLGLAASIKPNGYSVTATCHNSLIIKDDRPLCSFTAVTTIDPMNLLWVKRSALSSECLSHISKTSPKSHDVDSVIEYQNNIYVNNHIEKEIKNSDGKKITFTIKTPTLSEYIESGELWVNNVIASAEKLFEESSDVDDKRTAVEIMLRTSRLNIYNSYIKAISFSDSYVEDRATISELLEVMSSDDKLVIGLINAIKDYINNGYIALAALYNFNCPVCEEEGRNPEQPTGNVSGFKEFIPFNAVEHFFDLSALMTIKVSTRAN